MISCLEGWGKWGLSYLRSPVDLSDIVHIASEFYKQPYNMPNAQAIFKPALSCLLLSLWPKQVWKTHIQGVRKTPSLLEGLMKSHFISRL